MLLYEGKMRIGIQDYHVDIRASSLSTYLTAGGVHIDQGSTRELFRLQTGILALWVEGHLGSKSHCGDILLSDVPPDYLRVRDVEVMQKIMRAGFTVGVMQRHDDLQIVLDVFLRRSSNTQVSQCICFGIF